MFYELAESSWGPEEEAALRRVLASGRFTMGENVDAFERAFAEYVGVRYAVMVNSGSSANLAAVASLFYKRERPLERGDEAIVPAVSWSTTYFPLHQYGLRLRIADIELDTLNIDVHQLAAALTPRTRLLVGVSILGNPAALDVLRRFADDHGLYFLEDNCESLDAELAGRKTGAFGDVATFSFFFSHHISTMEGGMVVTDDLELYHLLRALRAHGWARDLPPDSPLLERPSDGGAEAYRFLVPGYNLRPTELAAAVGREQLKKLPRMTRTRRANMALFQQAFAGDERFVLQRENGTSSSFGFTMILDPGHGADRANVFSAMREADIGFRMITGGSIVRHDVARHLDYDLVAPLTQADIAHDRGFFVGNHPRDLGPQIDRLHEVLTRAAG